MATTQQITREQIRKLGFPAPISLSEEILGALSEEQKEVLSNLASLAQEEHRLAEKINSMRPTPSGILVLPGPALTVCENEDDWKVITIKERCQLKEIKGKIAGNLSKALDLGLGYLGLIQRQCANYGVNP